MHSITHVKGNRFYQQTDTDTSKITRHRDYKMRTILHTHTDTSVTVQTDNARKTVGDIKREARKVMDDNTKKCRDKQKVKERERELEMTLGETEREQVGKREMMH